MRNAIKKSLFIVIACLWAGATWAVDATFNPGAIFTASNNLSTTVTSPVDAAVSSTASLSNAKSGKLGSTGNYFQIILTSETFTAASINGYINTGTVSGNNWGFQFSKDGGQSWETEITQPNDGNKSAHDIAVNATIPAGANGFRVIRRAGTSTQVNTITLTLAPTGPVVVTGVSLDKTSISLEVNGTEQLTATVAPSNADNKNVTWSSSNTSVATVSENGLVTAIGAGTATITVTTEDGSKTATCTVTVTPPAAPIPVTGISLNKSTATIYVGSTETLTVSYTPADANTGKAITWSSSNENVATVSNGVVTAVAVGSAVITATSEGNFTATCTVTVDVMHATSVSLNKSSIELQIGGSETLIPLVLPSTASDRTVSWSSSNTAVAVVSNTGTVTGIAAGSAVITVSTNDGNHTANCAVTVTAGPPVPATDLSVHYPEIYEAKDIAGGYNTPLTVFGDREYEVYYINRDGTGKLLTIATSNADKAGNISDDAHSTASTTVTKDGWAKIGSSNGTGGDANATAKEEFNTSIRSVKFNSSSHYLEMHIQGYDQFSFYGQDNNADASKKKMFEVYIDDVKQTRTPVNPYGISRFSITAGRHLIRVTATGSSDSKLCSFSLRVAQEPRAKWLDGDDTTQVVMINDDIDPVYYYTKYNSKGETRLIWDGPTIPGISLATYNSDAIGDSLVLSGNANCAAGVYNFRVASYFNGIETRSIPGSIRVKAGIEKDRNTDLDIDAYKDEGMKAIKFRYYALSVNDVQLTWQNGQPAGISGSGNNGYYTIGGTPTQIGTFPYAITVVGADTTFRGTIEVSELNLGNNPVLYLHKTKKYKEDFIYKYLTNGSNKRNLIPRETMEDGLRPADQYAKYKWILISEDVDANNAEIMGIMHGNAGIPVLNMKAFSYANPTDSLKDIYGEPWGEPDNGSITDNGRFITVQRDDHPIFQALAKKKGDRIQILDTLAQKGRMPIAVKKQGSLCLATAWTKDINDYEADGVEETFLHEVPADMRGGKKYLCMPIACSDINRLTKEGERFIEKVIEYLLNDQATVSRPDLAISYFAIDGIAGIINPDNTIKLSIDTREHPDLDLTAVKPEITLTSTYAHCTPADGEVMDISYATFTPALFVVSDYINRRVYEVTIDLAAPQGIEETYTAGQWVTIYDIQGRKIATTNENIYSMALPSGMYIAVTENGQTIKLMR